MSAKGERCPADQPADRSVDAAGDTRREAMLRMAKYTAPAMLAMLVSNKAVAATLAE